MELALNLGAGEGTKPPFSHAPAPWINIDIRSSTRPDVVADIRELPFADQSAGRVYAGHVLEHLPFETVEAALLEILRVLAHGAPLLVVGPDMDKSVPLHAAGRITDERLASNRCHGDDDDPCTHSWDCSARLVMASLEEAGFMAVRELPIEDTPLEFPVFDRGTPDQMAVLAEAP